MFSRGEEPGQAFLMSPVVSYYEIDPIGDKDRKAPFAFAKPCLFAIASAS